MSLRAFYITGFVVLFIFDIASQICFKMAGIHAGPFVVEMAWLQRVLASPWVYGAILGYLGAFVTWMTLLKHAPIGPAFAASHLEVVGVMLISIPMFGEMLNLGQIIGAILIIAGVICLAFGERSPPQAQS